MILENKTNIALVDSVLSRGIASDKRKSSIHMGLISIYSSKNVGVRAISSALRMAGVKLDTIFFKDLIASDSPFPTQREYDLLIQLLRDLKVNFVGLSIICSSCRGIAETITSRIQKELDIPVIWGGPHASLMSEESLVHSDMVCQARATRQL